MLSPLAPQHAMRCRRPSTNGVTSSMLKPEELLCPLSYPHHSQPRAASPKVWADYILESIFLIPVSHIEPALPDRPKRRQRATRQGAQHTGKGSVVDKRGKDVITSGFGDELHAMDHKFQLQPEDVGFEQDWPTILVAPPWKVFDEARVHNIQ